MAGLKAVIFDLDGTLYNDKLLKIFTLISFFIFSLINPKKFINDIKIIYWFRKLRHSIKNHDNFIIEQKQYDLVADKLNLEVSLVRQRVEFWMFDLPSKFIYLCRYKGVKDLFQNLLDNNIIIVIFSDYPTKKKLQGLKLKCDLKVSSTDIAVNRLKPDPGGIKYILKSLDLLPSQVFFIGDRNDKDGQCARNADIQYYILDKNIFITNIFPLTFNNIKKIFHEK